MSISIFNVIQLLKLISLCCEGKSDYAEIKCKEVLNFKNAANIIHMADDFWPLKVAVFEYIIQSYFDSSDPTFMAKPIDDEPEVEEDADQNQDDDSDVGVLLKLIEICISDYSNYLEDRVKKTMLEMPNGKKVQMNKLCEDYIFYTGFNFIKAVLKRKKYDVGSLELKFYVLAKKVAETFYYTKDKKQQRQALNLI